ALPVFGANATNTVEIAWSPGHCDIEGSERADVLAKDATREDGNDRATITHARRRAKEEIAETWVREWKRKPHQERYASANRIPPSLRPRPHFRDLKHEVYGRATQCRVGGEYYSYFVPTEQADCACGAGYQTRAHILQECLRYDDHRHFLRRMSPTIH
ncbi:hypothetical protein B0H14DRAFT_2364733, partial [Mycena olivaceomarginata]